MLKGLTKIIAGDPIRRQIERYSETVEMINALESTMRQLDDVALRAKTAEFRGRLADGEGLDDLLPEAFAVVREVSVRTIGLRHYDVQLIGGMVLHEGKIAEMRTGEGKTLVATMPLYLNALEGKGTHLVTVNDYLARRDARWMGPVFHFLGMSVGVLQEASRTEYGRKAFLYDPARESSQEDVHQLKLVDRRLAYLADVTYGTNNEFGFDYLRDNMAQTLEARSQRAHHYAILDEVDNILIDEARTPLIISGPSHEDPELYVQMALVVKQLRPEDYEIVERDRTIALTEIGEDNVERLLNQPIRDPDRPEDITPEQARLLGHLEQALRAEYLFKRNKDYVVQGGRVIIVDEFTGRMMPGRRWSDGLHQAVEAKEGVRVRQENVTYATITLQNYFRKYAKLAGMTGTALTEAEEFNKIYNVDVIPLPTNLEYISTRPTSDLVEVDYRENGNKFSYYARRDDPEPKPVFWRRKDYPDVVFRTEEAKMRAVVQEILQRHVIGQPMLVGTTSVELSEKLANRLRGELLQRLAMILVLRETYFEANDIPDDGLRVTELLPLYEPLEALKPALMRPLARDLNLALNVLRPENLERLLSILELAPNYREKLAQVLESGIPHSVLNAKHHTEESQIIAGAGGFGAVTIATNMAGRGVDIKLGGELAEEVLATITRVLRRAGVDDPETLNLEERLTAIERADPEAIGIYGAEIELFRTYMEEEKQVREVGGLHVIGSERHEARRIDNQLRGRAARQGDPGSSQFFLSLEDELMRLFGGAQVSNLMERLNIDDATPIAHGIVNRTIEQAQTRVEGANFDRRKHLLEYDDVLNQQREVFYGQRDRVFVKDDLSSDIDEMLRTEVERHVESALADDDGPWRLLAWLEETQPTLNLDAGGVYPSFMLRLLLEELTEADEPQALKEALTEIARQALETQFEHLTRAIDEQLLRAVERLDDQIRQRVEMADLALEGTIIEAEEQGLEVDPQSLISAVEAAAGLRIRIDEQTRQQIREDPYTFRRRVPQLIEASFGVRVWAGLVQAVERRVGESLDLEPSLSTPLDWDEASALLHQALGRIWNDRTERLLAEIERDLAAHLERVDAFDEALKTRLLVQMSYGERAYFDRKTHQRMAMRVARFSYAYSAALLLDGIEAEALVEKVLAHLKRAGEVLKSSIGRAESAQNANARLDQLDSNLQNAVQRSLGVEAYSEHASAGPLRSLPPNSQEQISRAVGQAILTDFYRRLILSVGDRLWVEYLTQVEALRTSIGLEAYGQRDPLVQYKSRAVDMFRQLLADIRAGVVSRMFRIGQQAPAPAQRGPRAQVQAGQQADEQKPAKKGKRRRRRRRR